jgi:Cdc6-like AAA superfamily ATPase
MSDETEMNPHYEAMLNRLVSGVRIVPLETMNALTKEKASKARISRQDGLRCSWNAPERHLRSTVDRKGVWGQKLAGIESKLGTGFVYGLIGTRGNGKTQLAVEVMRTATERLMSAYYETAVMIFSRLKATFRPDATETEIKVIEQLRSHKLLVIDEIGKRGESAWENNLLFGLVDKRYNDMTDTILIANLEPAQFTECVGESLSSRMNETGGLIIADWPSRR